MNRILGLLLLVIAVVAAWAASDPGQHATRIAFLSDTHVTLRTNEAGVLNNRHLDEAIGAVNQAKVDLVLIAGDLTDNGDPDQFELFKTKVQRFKAPVWFVVGNHDVGMASHDEVKASITPDRVRRFASKLGPTWFAREHAGVRVIGINSCLFDTGFHEEAEQWKFLEKELSRRGAKPTLVMEHYPLFLKSVDEPVNGTWNVPPKVRQRLLSLLAQGEARAVLSGHLHYPITNRHDGILFLGNSAIAFGLPKGKQAVGWILLTVPREGELLFEFKNLE
jgi:3',5'-cyclic AMP phosphodiesterase CpdA